MGFETGLYPGTGCLSKASQIVPKSIYAKEAVLYELRKYILAAIDNTRAAECLQGKAKCLPGKRTATGKERSMIW
jgi:hypothetical protein